MLSGQRDDDSVKSMGGDHGVESRTVNDLLEQLRDQIKALDRRGTCSIDLCLDDEDAWLDTKRRFLGELGDRPAKSLGMLGGGIHCLQCVTNDCDHRFPQKADDVFERYTPNGKPIFTPFADAVLREMPQLADQLFAHSRELLAYTVKKPQSVDPLLPTVAKQRAVKVLGVLKIGYIHSLAFDDENRRAATIVLLETPHRFELRLVGLEGITLDEIRGLPDEDHLKIISRTLRRARHKLKRLMRQRRANIADQQMSPLSVLSQLAAALRRTSGKGKSRTRHAKKRHAQGDRPTGQAFKDARQVSRGLSRGRLRWRRHLIAGPCRRRLGRRQRQLRRRLRHARARRRRRRRRLRLRRWLRRGI